jgi:BirA family biotin operon repressor/biotin-[acetyl-CoA-carboxylase] ligase
LAVGVSVAEALDPQHSMGMGLKWPNDLWMGEPTSARKLAGTLIETVWVEGDHNTSRYTVIGMGINLHAPHNSEFGVPAAGLCEWMGDTLLPPEVLALLLAPLVHSIKMFEAQGFAPFRAGFANRDVLLGQAVRLSNGREGVACGVDAAGVLQLDTAAGRLAVSSDEVSVRLAMGAA